MHYCSLLSSTVHYYCSLSTTNVFSTVLSLRLMFSTTLLCLLMFSSDVLYCSVLFSFTILYLLFSSTFLYYCSLLLYSTVLYYCLYYCSLVLYSVVPYYCSLCTTVLYYSLLFSASVLSYCPLSATVLHYCSLLLYSTVLYCFNSGGDFLKTANWNTPFSTTVLPVLQCCSPCSPVLFSLFSSAVLSTVVTFESLSPLGQPRDRLLLQQDHLRADPREGLHPDHQRVAERLRDASPPRLGTHWWAEMGTFGIFKICSITKMIFCIFYQVNLTGSGLFK